LDQRIECADSTCGRSFYDDSLEEQRTFSLSFPNSSPFRARESAIATDLYALARGVKLTTRVGKPATLRANQCVNAGRMISTPLSLSLATSDATSLTRAGIPTLFRRLI